MSYIGLQSGGGIGEDALQFLRDNEDEIKKAGKFLYDNRAKVFQGVSNAQRFVEKNLKGNPRPIRFLQEGEVHLGLHNYTGPGTRVDQAAVRNFKPYNEIDACSRTHDLQFDKIFKMPLGRERSEQIRAADREALACYERHKGADGYRLASAGINTKISLEDLSPTIFDKIMGESYRGAEPGLTPKKKCRGRNLRKCHQQTGGDMDPESAVQLLTAAATPLVLAAMYGEYKLGQYIYDRFARNDQVVEPEP